MLDSVLEHFQNWWFFYLLLLYLLYSAYEHKKSLSHTAKFIAEAIDISHKTLAQNQKCYELLSEIKTLLEEKKP